jgi:hypothetical protein
VVSFIVPEEIRKEAECFADLIAQGQTVETVLMPKDCQRLTCLFSSPSCRRSPWSYGLCIRIIGICASVE